jgi:hypothetical protein
VYTIDAGCLADPLDHFGQGLSQIGRMHEFVGARRNRLEDDVMPMRRQHLKRMRQHRIVQWWMLVARLEFDGHDIARYPQARSMRNSPNALCSIFVERTRRLWLSSRCLLKSAFTSSGAVEDCFFGAGAEGESPFSATVCAKDLGQMWAIG